MASAATVAFPRFIFREQETFMRRMTLVIVTLLAASESGCCTSYKKGVESYASTLQQRGKTYYGLVLPELKKELVLNDAALKCLVDKDTGDGKTAACTCADGLPDDWEKNCTGWMK